MPCLSCLAGFHYECENPTESGGVWSCCCPDETIVSSVRGGPTKENDEVTDVESTGRKRAAIAYPISPGQVCEWAKLRFAGGGVNPIIGCNGNLATDRHHGPDKSTLNNSGGNVHRICATCHNRWHTRNDEHYGDRPPNGAPFVPLSGTCKEHDASTQATLKEIFDNEIEWTLRKAKQRTAGDEASNTTASNSSPTGNTETGEEARREAPYTTEEARH